VVLVAYAADTREDVVLWLLGSSTLDPVCLDSCGVEDVSILLLPVVLSSYFGLI
jgi:hypothetical protein